MSRASRRALYRASKRLLARLLGPRWRRPRRWLEWAIRRALRCRARGFYLKLLRQRAVATAIAAAILANAAACADPPLELSDVELGLKGFVFDGTAASGFAGQSVSGGGDVNGDGIPDVAISARGLGKVYVVFGKSGQASVSAAAIQGGSGGFVITGGPVGTDYGFPVALAGDVNGDGLDDVVVGSPWADPGSIADAGVSYVVFGKATTSQVALSSIAAGEGGFIVRGTTALQHSGRAVAGAGDVNGDGLDDIVVGAPGSWSGYYGGNGSAYVVFGKSGTGAVNLAAIAAGTGGFIIRNNYDGGGLGFSVSGAGNINGDGLDDLIISAPYNFNAGTNGVGESYVVFGKASTTAVTAADIESGTGGFVIRGIDYHDYSGWSVAGAGDVNGDGRDDMLIGVPYSDPGGKADAGSAFVVFGKSGTGVVLLANVASGSGGFWIKGEIANDYAGASVSAAGDVNGDGLADVIIGAPEAKKNEPGSAEQVGKGYVVLGKTTTTALDLVNVRSGLNGFSVLGADAYTYTGRSVAQAGDMDGDGFGDVIIGFPDTDNGASSNAGKAYILFSPLAVPLSVGMTDQGSAAPIRTGRVFIERLDGAVGFDSSFAGVDPIDGGVYKSAAADEQFYKVRTTASGFIPSPEQTVQSSRKGEIVAAVALAGDADLIAPNILRAAINVVDQSNVATGTRLLTKTVQVRVNGSNIGLTPTFGNGEMMFLGAPVGPVQVFIPNTAAYVFTAVSADLGTGVDRRVTLTAKLTPAAPRNGPRAALPGQIVGDILNSSAVPAAGLPNGLVLHTLDASAVSTFTRAAQDGSYFIPDAMAGAGTVQAFSEDGAIAGIAKNVIVVSGAVYGDGPGEDTLLSVPLPREDGDFDGLPDAYEAENFGGTTSQNASGDPDADGLDNFDEFTAGTNPNQSDSDSDGQSDPFELTYGSDPDNPAQTAAAPAELWVDFGFIGAPQVGTLLNPYASLGDALDVIASGGTIRFKGDVEDVSGARPGTPVDQPVRFEAFRGTIDLR